MKTLRSLSGKYVLVLSLLYIRGLYFVGLKIFSKLFTFESLSLFLNINTYTKLSIYLIVLNEIEQRRRP